jgi:hypothetical protein
VLAVLLTARPWFLRLLLRRVLALAEWIMKQLRRWTVTRGWVERPAAQRQWDCAFQLILHLATEGPHAVSAGAAPVDMLKESDHAGDRRLRPGLNGTASAGEHD